MPVYSFDFERVPGTYSGRLPKDDRCPICGATGECADAAAVPMPFPPVDVPDEHVDQNGPLRPYTVTLHGVTTEMRLNDSDAARYGDAAVLIP